MRQDLGLEAREKKNEQVASFPEEFLCFLNKVQSYKTGNARQPSTVSELFSQSFFPYDLPVIRKHSLLERLVQDVNQSIHKFYLVKKGKLQTLIQSQKMVEKNQSQLPGNILRMIQKDKERKAHDDDQTRMDASQPTTETSLEQQ